MMKIFLLTFVVLFTTSGCLFKQKSTLPGIHKEAYETALNSGVVSFLTALPTQTKNSPNAIIIKEFVARNTEGAPAFAKTSEGGEIPLYDRVCIILNGIEMSPDNLNKLAESKISDVFPQTFPNNFPVKKKEEAKKVEEKPTEVKATPQSSAVSPVIKDPEVLSEDLIKHLEDLKEIDLKLVETVIKARFTYEYAQEVTKLNCPTIKGNFFKVITDKGNTYVCRVCSAYKVEDGFTEFICLVEKNMMMKVRAAGERAEILSEGFTFY